MAKTLLYVEAVVLIAWLVFYVGLSAKHKSEISFRPILTVAVVLALCFLAPNLLFLHLSVFLVFFIFVSRTDEVGLALLISILLTPALHFRLTAGGVWLLDYSLHHTMGLAAAVVLLIGHGLGGRSGRSAWQPHIPFLLFLLLIILIEGRGATASGWARQVLASLLTYAVPYWVVIRSCAPKLQDRKALLWIAAGGAMLAALAVFEMIFAWPVYLVLDQHYGIPVHGMVVKFRFGLMRSEGPMAEQTALGFVLVVGFIALLTSRRAFRNPLAYGAILGLFALGLFAPQSRGAWVGAAVGMIAAALYIRPRNSLVRPVIGAVGSLFVVLLALSYGGQSAETTGSLAYRDRLWTRGFEEFWHNPLLGSRWQDVVQRLADLRQGEGIVGLVNSYLYVALTGGALGLLLFVVSLSLPLHRLWRARNAARSEETRSIAGFSFAVMLSAIVMIAFTSLITRPILLVFICAALGGMATARAGGERRPRLRGTVMGDSPEPVSQL